MGLLWHVLGYEWRGAGYWANAKNGEVGSFKPWTATYSTSEKTLMVVPANEEELRDAVLAYGQTRGPIRVVGSGHSWSATGYTDGTMIDVRRLNRVIRMDERRVTVEAGMKVQDAVQFLLERGFCLYGTGSIRAQAIGGVVSHGVHGPHPDGLNRHVVGMRVLLASGEFRELDDDESLFMWRASMGLLGVIVQVTFEIFPLAWLKLERSPIRGFDDLDVLGRHLNVDGGTHTTFTGFLYPSTYCSLQNIGWKRVGYFLTEERREIPALKNQTDLHSRWLLHFNDHMHPAMQYVSNGFLGNWVGCLEQILADLGHSTLLSGPDEDILPNDGLIPPFYEIIDYEYMVPLRHCKTFAYELMVEQRFGRVLIPICLRLMRGETSCLSMAQEDSCVFGIESMRGMAYSMDVIAMEKRVAELQGFAHLGKVAPGNFRFYRYPCLDRFRKTRQQLDPSNVFLTPFFATMLRLDSSANAAAAAAVTAQEEFEPVIRSRYYSVRRDMLFSLSCWLTAIIAWFFSVKLLYPKTDDEPIHEYSRINAYIYGPRQF